MAEGYHESKRLVQLLYAKGHSAQSGLFGRLHSSVSTCHKGVSLYLGSINKTRLKVVDMRGVAQEGQPKRNKARCFQVLINWH